MLGKPFSWSRAGAAGEAGEPGDPGWDPVTRGVRLRRGPGEEATATLSERVTVMELLKVREKPSSNALPRPP